MNDQDEGGASLQAAVAAIGGQVGLGWHLAGMHVPGLRYAMDVALRLEQANVYARAVGLTEEETQEVVDYVRTIPYMLPGGMPDEVQSRALRRAMNEEWRS